MNYGSLNGSRQAALLEKHYPEMRFGGFTDVDGTIAFYLRVVALAKAAELVVDLGCGRGAHCDDQVSSRRDLRDLRGDRRKVIGLDVDRGAAANPGIDEFRLIADETWPLDDASVDLCVADYVLEHILEPVGFLREAVRILKPEGVLCIRTTNALGYVGLAASALPKRWHRQILRETQSSRQPKDIFPTYYRCNTRKKLDSALRDLGFDACVYTYAAEPSYFGSSATALAATVRLQRWTPRSFWPTIFAFARKASGKQAISGIATRCICT